MDSEILKTFIHYAVTLIEGLGVLVIVLGLVLGGIYSLFQIGKGGDGVFRSYRIRIGRSLQLGLEFLVAADIIRTVTVRPTMQEVLTLGLLVLIRTLLSWSVSVETDGRWPWQSARNP
jgi:uncharacterized membrane protein